MTDVAEVELMVQPAGTCGWVMVIGVVSLSRDAALGFQVMPSVWVVLAPGAMAWVTRKTVVA